jgi:hypothetical protein
MKNLMILVLQKENYICYILMELHQLCRKRIFEFLDIGYKYKEKYTRVIIFF